MPVRPQSASPATKGRGAVGNPSGRYERLKRHAFDDGWAPMAPPPQKSKSGVSDRAADRGVDGMAGGTADGTADGGDPEFDFAPLLRTTVTVETPRSIITRNTSPDIPFDRSINPYRGCEHGCVYCFARPTHAWLGLSPGLDFESRLFAKPDAAALLEKELRRPGYECRTIAMGTNTDPYQPIERTYKITRQILEVLAAHNHPVSIVTKSTLVTRDIDILAPMAKKGLVKVIVSVTSLDRKLARTLEPRAPTPVRRLSAIADLAKAGIPAGVMFAPVIPVLNDGELEAVLGAARKAGAELAGYVLLRLPLEIKDLFAEWLDVHAPGKAKRVLSMVRETRGGRLNDPNYGSRMIGQGPYARLIRKRFHLACRRLELNKTDMRLNASSFMRPARPGDQMALL